MVQPDEIIRSNRKTLAISIDCNNRLIVRAPYRCGEERIFAFIQEKETWILRKKAERVGTGIELPPESLDGYEFLLLGERHRISLTEDRKIGYDKNVRAVYLPDVTEDFDAKGIGGDHRYACSGCDGTAFGPVFGADADTPYMLMLAYGIYSDTEREDNDHQIILQYDWRQFESYAKPLTQEQPHQSGPRADARYFAFTGNTNWGVQNLYYDREHAQWMLFVYRGKKPQYPNYGLYLVDAAKAAERKPLAGLNGEVGALLTLKTLGNVHEESGICGFDIDLGQFGVHGLGDNLFYLARPTKQTTPFKAQGATLELYRYTGKAPAGFELL